MYVCIIRTFPDVQLADQTNSTWNSVLSQLLQKGGFGTHFTVKCDKQVIVDLIKFKVLGH